MSDEHQGPDRNEPVSQAVALIAAAQEAAAARNARGMVEALYASGYFAGLKRQLQRKWNRLPAADVDDCIAEAVADAYAAVSGRRRIGDLAAWLWKAADHLAHERWSHNHARSRSLDEAPEGEAYDRFNEEERAARDALADHRRSEAVRLARQLLPAVGHGQVRDVVTLLIDAVEAGEPDLPAEVVAETLGITRAAARSLMSRGLDRLKTAARNEGVDLTGELPMEILPDQDPSQEETDS